MSTFNLLIIEVPHNKAEFVSQVAQKAGSFGGTVSIGRSLADNNIKAALGFGESTVELLFILTQDEQTEKISEAIKLATESEKSHFGKLIQLKANSIIKTGKVSSGEINMEKNFEYELITVILNKGYADDVMAVARKHGAKGGTVINARGTAKEDDEKFFGIPIVPEKEMLLIAIESNKKDEILENIKSLPYLVQPGSGIAFCTPIEDLSILGKSNSN
jgi:nitrogen regulatory protein PII